ncbi:MAG: response regulator [Sphingobium sp.]|nr:response regulator [Sphingobium sp.]MBP8669771.1 response regulator [Sphingobium sp.]MBP9156469.1 response regulator [Sphingobium sp.]
MSAAQGSSYKQDILALAAEPGRRLMMPLLLLAAMLSALLVFFALGDWIIAAGFAATTLGMAAIVMVLRPGEAAVVATREVPPDWSIVRAAANGAGIAVAVTDQSGRLVCASDLYGEWFSGWPAPSALPFDADHVTALVQTGRTAARDGEGRCTGLIHGAMKLAAQVTRTGRADDYLLWHFEPVRQSSVMEDFGRMISGEVGLQLGDAGLMAAIIGSEGRIRTANDAFLMRAAGRTDADLAGREFTEFFRRDEQGRIFFQREALATLPVAVFRVLLKAGQPDGPALILLIDQPGDVTLGGSSLSYLQALLALLPFGVAMADRDGRLLFLNSVFGRAANVPDGQTPSYPGDLVVAEDQAALASAVRRYAVGPQMSGDIAVRLRNQPEEPVAFSLAGVRGLGEAAVLLSLKDDNEEGRLKRQVAQATKMQAVGQLAGGVAHDFNNILTAIIGHCDLMLMRHTPGDSDYDDIQQVKSNSNRAASLTRQLLAFSRQQTLRPQVIQLPDIVSDVSSLLKRLIGEKVRLEVTHGRNLGHVRADPGQIEQVIVNLVVNARDAMPDGGTLSIQTFAVSAAQAREMRSTVLPAADYTGLTVSDTGTGIPPEILPKIFEPFFTTKEVGKGTGLGLSTVYGIVKQSGGYIFADSEPGRGTKFSVYLPVHAAGVDEKEPASIKSAPPSRAEWGTGTILLVEDEDMVRAVAERALSRQGYSVLTAADGELGLEALDKAEKVDLLISDVVMPNMDGPAMVRVARARRPDLPVLFMSGYAEEQLRKSIDMDNVSFLPKPFSVAQLSEAVAEVFAQAARNRAEP